MRSTPMLRATAQAGKAGSANLKPSEPNIIVVGSIRMDLFAQQDILLIETAGINVQPMVLHHRDVCGL